MTALENAGCELLISLLNLDATTHHQVVVAGWSMVLHLSASIPHLQGIFKSTFLLQSEGNILIVSIPAQWKELHRHM